MSEGNSAASIRPRRSVLYMPGSNARALEKARTLPADAVILDLEDAVAPDAKVEARGRIVDTVKAGGFGPREVVIRINGLDTPWGPDDLEAAASATPDAILLPKVQSVEQEYQQLKNKLPKGQPVPVEVQEIRWMIEELRVSFFAQNLGTPYPISDKRVLQAIHGVKI